MDNPNKLPTGVDWDFELLEKIDKECARIAKGYGLDTYPNQIDIITSEQMIDAYSSIGLPTMYPHWSFGKSFIQEEKTYKKGESGLAYEIVINSNPCIAYLMEENSLMMQTLVIAHASYGHNSFFKGNYLFKTWTDAAGITDYMLYAKRYVKECEEKYGKGQVELVLDACHALKNYGVDKYKRPPKLSAEKKKERQRESAEYAQSQVNELWDTLTKKSYENDDSNSMEPEENILYFIEKNAPNIPAWKREIVRIVRKISQYFYPQGQTQLMNEGWATFWHYTILNDMYDEGFVGDGFMLEFLRSHAAVCYQRAGSAINPYALGFAMYKDIKRMCEDPTPEDREWFPELVGKDWKEELDYAMRNFRDESFIRQYLSPKIIRDFRLFSLHDNSDSPSYEVTEIHNDEGYRRIRSQLADQYSRGYYTPDIQVVKANTKTDRQLYLGYQCRNGVELNNDDAFEVLRYLRYLWGFKVILRSYDETGSVTEIRTSL